MGIVALNDETRESKGRGANFADRADEKHAKDVSEMDAGDARVQERQVEKENTPATAYRHTLCLFLTTERSAARPHHRHERIHSGGKLSVER